MSSPLANAAPLLQIEGLSVSFETPLGRVKAAEDVCFDLREGETLALVGETGCGKSVVASAIMQLLPNNASVQGRAVFAGRDLLALGEKEMARIRGSEIAIVFQNPSLALNPIMRVGEQIAEPLQVHKGISRTRSLQMAEDMLEPPGPGEEGEGEDVPLPVLRRHESEGDDRHFHDSLAQDHNSRRAQQRPGLALWPGK